ncbi:MAG: hypothetical protein E6K53_01395 [Gammaproteobacteria bacterium]|nr:MAG: hypothetical protein E6K53_01395 [Gammaproteobacteria bacterium]
MRVLVWLLVVALALAGRLRRDEWLALAAFGLAIVLLLWQAPRALRFGVIALACATVGLLIACGAALAVAAAPALFCALVAWTFARSLRAHRRPLIARAMAIVDGEAVSAQPAMTAYARGLTLLWAVWLGLWALVAALLVALEYIGVAPAFTWLPSARLFALALPLGVALLFVLEFALRRWLLPSAPYVRFTDFLLRVAHAWPRLLDDEVAPVNPPTRPGVDAAHAISRQPGSDST